MEIRITKLTGKELLHSAAKRTFVGTTNISLSSMYAKEHSPIRTQLFWIEFDDIPLYVSTHFIRHHVGSQPFALTHRTDRKGGVNTLMDFIDEDLMYEINYLIEDNKLDINKFKHLMSKIDTKFGRNTPTNLGLCINAQSLIDMAKVRLCGKADVKTQEVMYTLKKVMKTVDPELSQFLVPTCIYRNGICNEGNRSCGYNKTVAFKQQLQEYLKLF